VIPKTVFWIVSVSLLGLALAIALRARDRGTELEKLRADMQGIRAKADLQRDQCVDARAQAETRVYEADARASKAEAQLKTVKKQLADWQSVGNRSGIVKWLGEHANCVGRAADGRCSKYRTPDGAIVETDAP
jgi:hypothetical protein